MSIYSGKELNDFKDGLFVLISDSSVENYRIKACGGRGIAGNRKHSLQ